MGLEAGEGEKGLGKTFFFVAVVGLPSFPPSCSSAELLSRMMPTNGGCKVHGGWYAVGIANLFSCGVRQLARLHVNMLASLIPPDGLV